MHQTSSFSEPHSKVYPKAACHSHTRVTSIQGGNMVVQWLLFCLPAQFGSRGLHNLKQLAPSCHALALQYWQAPVGIVWVHLWEAGMWMPACSQETKLEGFRFHWFSAQDKRVSNLWWQELSSSGHLWQMLLQLFKACTPRSKQRDSIVSSSSVLLFEEMGCASCSQIWKLLQKTRKSLNQATLSSSKEGNKWNKKGNYNSILVSTDAPIHSLILYTQSAMPSS